MPAGGRTRAQRLLGVLPLVVLVGVVAVLVAVRVARGPGTDPTAPTGPGPAVTSLALPPAAAATALLDAVTHVPAGVLDRVGTGGVGTVPIAVNGSAVTADGRPRVVWVGSEDCATCAAMRWSMVIALSRFGALGGLGLAASATDAPYPGTVGPTFRDATFRSDLLGVTFYESQVSGGPSSRPVTATDRALLRRYDAPPYVTDDEPRPFVLFAGQYVSAGSLYTPGVLDGLDAAAVAAAVADPGSAAGAAVDGAANVLTAVVCVTTDGKPGDVCTAPGVVAARAILGTRVS